MYAYEPGEVSSALASQAYGETQSLRGRVDKLEKQITALIDAVDTIAERLGIEP